MSKPVSVAQQSGVTLIELLVALSIASLFCAALYGFFRLHQNVLRAEEVRLSVQEGSRLTIDFMVRELRQAGARPVRTGPCTGFERLTVAETQSIAMQYDFRGDVDGTPPDGCPDDPSEHIAYIYDSSAQVLRRATGGGRPQPFINDVPPDGFLLRYFDRDGTELSPALSALERATVQAIEVTIRTSRAHPNPQVATPITAELSSLVFFPSPPG